MEVALGGGPRSDVRLDGSTSPDAIGDPNSIANPRIHHAAFKGIDTLVDLFLQVTQPLFTVCRGVCVACVVCVARARACVCCLNVNPVCRWEESRERPSGRN